MISIIINNYNYGHFLANAIDSALQQTHPDCEVIVVDDGSTDHSPALLEHYGKRIISLCKANGGQASALNAGFAQSRGELVIFLDADDFLVPHIAEQVWQTWQANPQASKIQYRMQVVDQTGQPTGELKPAPHLPLCSGDLRSQELTFPFDLTWMATSGNAFATQALRQIFPIPESDYRILADYYLAHLTPLLGQVLFLAEIGACYRVHQTNHYTQNPATLNLEQMRKTIVHTRRTVTHLQRLARQLNLEKVGHGEAELSVADLANRLVSLRFAPAQHPLAGESWGRLLHLGLVAARHRFDVAPPMRVLFMLWFLAFAFAPLPLAHWLSEQFFLPEKRVRLNQVLRLLR